MESRLSKDGFIFLFYMLFIFCASRDVEAGKINYAKGFAVDF